MKQLLSRISLTRIPLRHFSLRHLPLLSTTVALCFCAVFASLICLVSPQVFAQKRDHLTEQEADLVREAQELDKRTAVFIKAAERRLLAITDEATALKRQEKDAEKWGVVKGTRAQLLSDIYRILDEAVVNIDDTASRDPKSTLLHKSLHKLAEASSVFLPQLLPMRQTIADERERETLESVLDKAQEIIEADHAHAGDAPPEVKSKDEKKSDKAKKGN